MKFCRDIHGPQGIKPALVNAHLTFFVVPSLVNYFVFQLNILKAISLFLINLVGYKYS